MQDGVVGIDLGGTRTKFGLVTKEGTLLAYNAIPTDSAISYQRFFKRLHHHIVDLQSSLDTQFNILGVGVGAPTGNFTTGHIESASNLFWEGNVPVVQMMEEYTDLPTVLINDANASAVGEMLYGAAKGMQNFISITLGTGLGCGMVTNGQLVTGQKGHAGEIGHTTVYYDGRPCTCGHQGCLETYVSAPGLVVTVQELMTETEIESELRTIALADLDARKITQAARRQDKLALKAFEYTGKILGLELADLVACMNPEAIIISGGVAQAGSLILEPAKQNMEDHLLDMFKNQVDIIPSSLTEKNAAILGAAAAAWDKLETPTTSKV